MTTAEYRKREEMDDRLCATVRQLMESQAYRELAAAQMFGHGLKFVPLHQVAEIHGLAHP